MRFVRCTMLAAVMVGLAWQACWGAGFGIYEWSARGNALGGALVGRADDPSAVAYNPAGITQLEGLQMQLGATFIGPMVDVDTGDKTTTSEKNWWIPPHFFATYKVNDRYSLGLGVYSRYGLGTEFDSKWPGRYNAYEGVIKAVSVNPNLAISLTDSFSVALGVEAMYFDFLYKKKIPTGPIVGQDVGDINAKLHADDVGFGFNLGLHYQPCQYAKVGLTYRSQVQLRMDGDADFDRPAAFDANPQLQPLFKNGNVSGEVTLPDSWSAGVAIYPLENLSLELGAVYTRWSSYEDLTIKYDQTPVPGMTSTTTKKDWKDVWRFNAGLEYKALDWLDLRFGYIFDQSPIPDDTIDYLVPANDRHLFSFGPGFHFGNMDLDLSYTYLMIKERNIAGRPADGVLEGKSHNGYAHMLGVSVGYRF
ncbi:MAG: transporter [Deltaproteobacteria bacterium]|nr:transporter [Deltaproteobacteria bacterium]